MNDAEWMRQAIAKAREGVAAKQSPFGAVVVRDGQVVCAAHNTVLHDTDPTAHAEINAVRQAAKLLSTIALRGCTMFATCEPCPMCLSAIHWAKFDRVVFGADTADATAAGFSELAMPARTLAAAAGSPLRIEGGLLVDECRALFRDWLATPGQQTY